MELKKRKLIYICQACRNKFKQMPLLMNRINDLEKQIYEIKNAKSDSSVGEKSHTNIDDMTKKIQEEMLADITDNFRQIIKDEMAEVNKKIGNLTESNKDLVKLFTGAPSNVGIKSAPLHVDKGKQQAKVNSESINNISNKQLNAGKNKPYNTQKHTNENIQLQTPASTLPNKSNEPVNTTKSFNSYNNRTSNTLASSKSPFKVKAKYAME